MFSLIKSNCSAFFRLIFIFIYLFCSFYSSPAPYITSSIFQRPEIAIICIFYFFYYCYCYYYNLFLYFFPNSVRVFHWSLSDSKYPQVSRTLRSILADINNTVVYMVLIPTPISTSSNLFPKPLMTVPSTPISIGITVTNINWYHIAFLFLWQSLFYCRFYFLVLLSTPLEFFTSVLADFSLEFEWQQVFSSLQDSSQDSGSSQQCCHLDSLYPSANFQVLQAF